ncbi:2-oxoisovalerate dehydrogenase subunit alpha [Vibrio nigripulchritudo SFn27]|uniref:2-oxoisovalerate dehydrogenase subunit alpha n=1 Tax=Vibrio nigripulchritudo TaxID=28173 RepID=U4K398_9VIBR|nr:thiamine pyrophosphate-dependent dehydrogenase E1 component subunit alpha [Vibrio nigripulchritudo]CCN83808.1 2-oxoisovalerate dehydrogenase subunit alpha [Vibrio nigripulchritudo BLFn1]CCN87184.1 2-oxoisovalerate dehydrogenase subunit alpha [Vibrio nigripulchritudo SFn27]CCN94540.1 2-oxoisovalerate dehydrogenase subunit alpha [Vibrio nigripulchritudo ENn2]CCO40894.1 2-oxoisovalerate dehydrogenase subunit alpha [Vibrio nigripulchritudo SFn135]CCO54973.1 2-oxoisovalerate dehydrogenase subuni
MDRSKHFQDISPPCSWQSRLHIPKASSRPDTRSDFSQLNIDPSHYCYDRPAFDASAESIRNMAYQLVRVLDDNGQARGDWLPDITPEQLRLGLKHMMHVRVYDRRMFKMQRQGKLSFYMKCTGEEAIAVAQAMALDEQDMLFPTYRQQGLLFVRGRPVVDMMCHCISNAKDNLKGRQMPVFYSWAEGNYFTISGNLATQFSQAVGWAMASAYKGETAIASAWVGDGSTAESDFYHALLFASTYQAPVILNVVNNQWAISTPQSFASAGTTFAARGIGFDIPTLRVDGNDFLAVYAVTKWASERAKSGFGPTLIELVSYRTEGHSTSDNPDAYRSKTESQEWPLGDPIERLKQYLIDQAEWSEDQHQTLQEELEKAVADNWKEATSYGTLEEGPHWSVESLFDDVFKEVPEHLVRQRKEIGEQ